MLVVTGVFFTSCEKKPEPEEKKEPISLGISKSFLSIPVYIAIAHDFFESEGLDLDIKEYGSGKLATDAMLRGDVSISTAADMPIVFNSFKEHDFCVFSTFTSTYSFVKIIGRKDKGVRTAKDLKGKKIGANMGTSSHFYLGAFLTYNHLALKDIEIINKKTGQLPDALIKGEVDAISVWPPHTQKALKALGDNAVFLKSPEIYRQTFSLAAKKDLVSKRRPALEKILRALDKAALYINTNREKTVTALTGIFKVENDVIETVLNEYRFGISLDQALLVGLDDIARWALENQFVREKKIPNYLEHLCTGVMDAVKPNAVTIIR